MRWIDGALVVVAVFGELAAMKTVSRAPTPELRRAYLSTTALWLVILLLAVKGYALD